MRVTVIAHDATRTGAPIVLLRLLGAPRPEDVEVEVVLRRGGPLVDDLAARCDSLTVLEPGPGRGRAGTVAAALDQLGRDRAGAAVRAGAGRARRGRRPAPDVVLVHGAGGAMLLDTVPTAGARLVVHLHELELGLARSLPGAAAGDLLGRADQVLAVSTPVADLARAAGARADAVSIVPGVVADGPPARSDVADAALLFALAGAVDGPVVMGIGSPGWRKGTDRLSAVAHELARTRPDATVAWVGGERGTVAAGPLAHLPDRPDPWALAAGAAAVVVPSREDPLPLVALEAGRHGRAVIATPTGGLPDLLADGRGTVVPDHDLEALAAAVEATLADPDAARARAAALKDHVDEHFTVAAVAPLWWAALTP